MITREFGDGGWAAGCKDAPPPLHVYDTESQHANWHPLPRPAMGPTHPGTVLVTVPQDPANLFGDDPTDPGRQSARRTATAGMVARLNIHTGTQHNVRGSGVRR